MEGKINLIFDFDGTLFDSYDSSSEWILSCCTKSHIKTTKETIKELCLLHDANYAFKEIMKGNYIHLFRFAITCLFNKQNIDNIFPFPNAEKVLSNKKFSCFLYTHRGKNANKIINKFGYEKYFIEIVNSTYHFKHKPNSEGVDYLIKKYKLNKDKTFYVGDRLIDILCGINAGIKTIFFKSSNLDIDSSKANYIINNLDEINDLELI